ncbi:MAG TPA: DVU3141 family protein [Pseudomonadales bacterium]
MCLLVALLCGCAGHGPDTQRLAGDEHAAPLPEPLQPLFGRPGTAQQALGESPWGSGVTIVLQDIYPAASGRRCRNFLVRGQRPLPQRDDIRGLETAPAAAVVPGLACRNGDGEWVQVRRLHHHGRPLLEAAP